MPNRLYVAWQDDVSRKWNTIARLSKIGLGYDFVFTQGVKKLNNIPADVFKMDPRYTYVFDRLIPLFTNRIPPRSRGDFAKIAAWLNIQDTNDEFELLSKFGLIPGTDSILLYPEPQINNGIYSLEFFVHGIRHMHSDVLTWCDKLEAESQLLPVLDVQNPVDPCAVALRSTKDTILVGYVPTFYAPDIKTILSDEELCSSARITVVKNNIDAPIQLRLLCRFEAEVRKDFEALRSDIHRPYTAFEGATDNLTTPRRPGARAPQTPQRDTASRY